MNIVSVLAFLQTRLSSGLLEAQDFKIPQPKDNAQPSAAPSSADPSAADPGATASGGMPDGFIHTGPSTGEMLIGILAALLATAIFFALRGAVYNHLIERRVPPSAARSAGWACFLFLTVFAWTVIAGIVGELWYSLAYLLLGMIAIVATLIFFLASFFGALKKAG